MAEEVGPVDAALLPVGGWGPYLGEGHLNAERAAEALARLAPRNAVPVHYGTYWPIGMDAVRPHEFHAPGEEFVRLAAERAPAVKVYRRARGERAPGGRAVIVVLAAATTSGQESAQQAIGYPTLFLLVLIGALVPVVPTGALVSSAAVVAFHQTAPFAMLLVFGVASLAAFLGDVALYWLAGAVSARRTARAGWPRSSPGRPRTASHRPRRSWPSTG